MSDQVTGAEILSARSTDLVRYLQANGYELKRSGDQYCLKEHDSLKISGNKWHWFSKGIGGNSIDFLVKYEGMSFTDAVRALNEQGPPVSARNMTDHSKTVEQPKEMVMPDKAGDNRRAYAFLFVQSLFLLSIKCFFCLLNCS